MSRLYTARLGGRANLPRERHVAAAVSRVPPRERLTVPVSRLFTARTLNRKRQSIVSQPDVLRQQQFGFDMSKIMAHMREIRSAGRDAVGSLDSLLQGHVRLVGSVPQRIDHQRINSTRRFLGVPGHFLAIGEIRQQLAPPAAKNQTRRYRLSMGQIEWDDFRLAEPKRPVNDHWFGPNVVEKAIFAFKGVLKNAPQVVERPLGGIDRHGLVFHLTESTQIVKTENMIRVRMRINHSVNLRDGFAQTLCAKIRRRIHLDDQFRRPHLDCAAQAFVA